MTTENLGNQINTVVELKTNQFYYVKSVRFSKEFVLRKCLGNYGIANGKVYFALDQIETAQTLAHKFKNDIMPNSFVCWDFEVNLNYIIHEVGSIKAN